MKLLRALAALLAALFVAPFEAHAHSGVPISTEVLFSERDGKAVPAYSTTFGLLSQDAKGDWRLTCEETKEQGRKLFKVWPDGEVGMAYAAGYLFSEDGCNFTRAKGVAASARTLETANVQSGATPTLVLLTDLLDGQQPGTNLFVSSDRGRNFQQVIVPKPVTILSMVVSRTTPPEIVLVGDLAVQDAEGMSTRERWLLRSSTCITTPNCGEQDWTTQQLTANEVTLGVTKLLAVLPEGLFLRNVTGEASSLLRSTDAGKSFIKVLPTTNLTLPNPIDFLSKGGENDLWLSAGLQQTFHSSDGGATWERRPDMGDIRCIEQSGDALHACVVDLEKNTVASRSTDGGKTWSPALRYDQVTGIKQCPTSSDVGIACDAMWLLISITFKGQQTNPPVVTPSPAPETKASGCFSTEPSLLALLALSLIRRRR
jgi:hypothetical protein